MGDYHVADSTPPEISMRHMSADLESAQLRPTYWIQGEHYTRIPFGREEGGGGEAEECLDCGAGRGQLHVPGCEHEQCPRCGGKVISCDCGYGRPARPRKTN